MSEYIVEVFGIVQDFADLHGDMNTPLYEAIMDVMLSRQREPIVRCRDCVYYEEHNGEHWCIQHDIMTLKDMSDGFCKWGERKDESLVEFIEREGRKRDTND